MKKRPEGSRSSSRHRKSDADAGSDAEDAEDEDEDPSSDEEDTSLTDDAADDLLVSSAASTTSSPVATTSNTTDSSNVEDLGDLHYADALTDHRSMVYSDVAPFKIPVATATHRSRRSTIEEPAPVTDAKSRSPAREASPTTSKKKSSAKKKNTSASTDSAEYDSDAESPDSDVATVDSAEEVSFLPTKVQTLPSLQAHLISPPATKTLVTPTVGQGSLPIAMPSLPMPHQPASWHQLMLSGLISSDLDSMEDLTDSPVPEPAASLAQGDTIWVNLSDFIRILISENKKQGIGIGSKLVEPEVTARLEAWFCRPTTGASSTDSPILVSMLLPIFLGLQGTERFFDVIPLNINGYRSDNRTLSALDSWAPLLQMSVENFRARIYNPLPTESLECYLIYFDLNIPHPDLSSMAPTEILTWHVPFQNALWSHGQISFAHSGPLRVKIINPLSEDRVIFCHFDSQISVRKALCPCFQKRGLFSFSRYQVVRGFGVAGGACHGTVVSSPGCPAVYDIQLAADKDGDFDVAWLCDVLSPQGLSKTSMFDGLVSQIGIPSKFLPT